MPKPPTAEETALAEMEKVVDTLTRELTRYADASSTSHNASRHMEILAGQARKRVREIRHELRASRLRARVGALL